MKSATIKRQPAAVSANPPAPQTPKVFVATPCYGGMLCMTYVQGLQLLLRSFDASGVKHRWFPLGNESLVTRARNRCVAEFLKTDCTDLLFLDADVGFTPKDVAAMVRSSFDVVCGAYPMKNYSWHAVKEAVEDGMPPHLLGEMGAMYAVNLPADAQSTGRCSVIEEGGSRFVEVLDAATGFLLIRRHVIEKFIAHYRDEIAYVVDEQGAEGETRYAVFSDGRDPGAIAAGEPPRWLSEDYMFSRMWQRMGGKIYMCIDVSLSHTGTHTWKGDVAKLFAVGDEEADAAAAKNAAKAPAADAAAEEELPVEMVSP